MAKHFALASTGCSGARSPALDGPLPPSACRLATAAWDSDSQLIAAVFPELYLWITRDDVVAQNDEWIGRYQKTMEQR